MAGENFVIRHGRLTRDPEIKTGAKNGNEWTKVDFSLAVDNAYPKDDASFYNCVLFGKRAEAFNKFCKKGSEVVVYGEFEQEHWEKDGEKKSAWKLNVTNFEFCGSAKKNEAEGIPPAPDETDTEDVPF